jgi:phage-related minor tail protein
MAAMLAGPLAQAERDHTVAQERLRQLAKESPIAAAGLTQALEDEAKAYQKTREEIEKSLDPIGQVLEAQRFELDMIGKSNAEREVMNALIAAGVDLRGQDAQAALAQARANQAEAESRQRSIDLMDQFRSSASDALTDFVTGAKSAKDALKDFFDSMAEAITKAIADKWIAQLFGAQGSDGAGTTGGGWLSTIMGLFGGGSANGNAFMGGQVQAFATGGVVDRTTAFGMSGGRFGIMGEAGPEAIIPLHRGPDGKLGVRMAANDDGPRERVVNNNTTFVLPSTYTPQTQAQVAQNQQRAATRATSRNR